MNPVLQALKELGQFLGAKLDTLAAASRAPIKVDMSDSSSKLGSSAAALVAAAKSIDASAKSMESYTNVSKTLKGDVAALSKELSASTRAVAEAAKSIESASKAQDVTKLKTQLEDLAAASNKIAANIASISPADMSPTVSALKDVVKAVKSLKLNVEATDVSRLNDVVTELVSLGTKLETISRKNKSDEILAAIKAIKLEIPKEFKLEAGQVAQIVHSGGGLGGATGSNLQPSKATVANVALTTANTQYSYTFPAQTTGFRIKLRGQGTLMYYAWATGKMPTSGDGTAYSTVQQNHELVREQLDIGGKTIYLQTDENTHVAEIESYQI